jgi:predicted RNase H-like HicB family nuclease
VKDHLLSLKQVALPDRANLVGGRDRLGPGRAVEPEVRDAWLARVPSVPGCHTFGRSLDQARRRIREALALWVDDAETADLEFDLRLPRELRQEVDRARSTRDRSAEAQRIAADEIRCAAIDLTDRLALSRRDAAELLGISHQRIQQLL